MAFSESPDATHKLHHISWWWKRLASLPSLIENSRFKHYLTFFLTQKKKCLKCSSPNLVLKWKISESHELRTILIEIFKSKKKLLLSKGGGSLNHSELILQFFPCLSDVDGRIGWTFLPEFARWQPQECDPQENTLRENGRNAQLLSISMNVVKSISFFIQQALKPPKVLKCKKKLTISLLRFTHSHLGN